MKNLIARFVKDESGATPPNTAWSPPASRSRSLLWSTASAPAWAPSSPRSAPRWS